MVVWLRGRSMCDAINASGQFDPDLCPLLSGLSPEEQRARMRTDPRIAACLAALEGPARTGPFRRPEYLPCPTEPATAPCRSP